MVFFVYYLSYLFTLAVPLDPGGGYRTEHETSVLLTLKVNLEEIVMVPILAANNEFSTYCIM